MVYSLRVKTLVLLTIAILGLGCSSAATKVSTAQVARDFYRARFEDSCHAVPDPAWCHGYAAVLNKADKDLVEANAALDLWHLAKAKMPLQLNALKTDATALKAGYKQ
jgi:hypothetical protein